MAHAHPQPLDVKLMNWLASGLFVAFVALGLGSFGWWLANWPVWSVGGITLVGDVTHQNAVTVRAHLASRLSGSFLTVNPQEVKALFETVPWVQQAVVRREFPNRLRVSIQEHEATAWWGESGSGKLVNMQGQVFEANPDDPQAENWSELAGPPGQSAQVYALFRQLQPVFAPLKREIQRLELDARGSWRVRLDNGALIELGRGEPAELMTRVTGFVRSVPQLTQRYGGRDLESADLRYPNGYAVRMRGVTTLTDEQAGKKQPKR